MDILTKVVGEDVLVDTAVLLGDTFGQFVDWKCACGEYHKIS